MELESRHIRLDCAALHLARDVAPHINLQRYLVRLDELADAVATERAGLSSTARYEAMRSVLVDQLDLRGNFEDHYAADNHYLHRVLDTHRGAPISLSILWIEVARRLKWPVSGVALPGHFIVRFDDSERYVLADPYHYGVSLNINDCRELVRQRFDGRLRFTERHLRAASARKIIVRTLSNLRGIYLAANDMPRLGLTLRRLAAAQPHSGKHLRDLAAVYTRQGDVRNACAQLALYLKRKPDAHDSTVIRRNLRQLRAALVARN